MDKRLIVEAAAVPSPRPRLARRGGDQSGGPVGERGGGVGGDVGLHGEMPGGARGATGSGVPLQADVGQSEEAQALSPAARAPEQFGDHEATPSLRLEPPAPQNQSMTVRASLSLR
jgi:hypothetical protein